MAVVGTAGRGLIVYQLEGKPQEFKRIESPLKYQHRCVAIFRDKKNSPVGNESYLLDILTCVIECHLQRE
jgi:mRNA export factor